MGQEHPRRPSPPLTRTTLGQLCAAPWVSRLRLAATEPLVAQLALRISALDHFATWEAPIFLELHLLLILNYI